MWGQLRSAPAEGRTLLFARNKGTHARKDRRTFALFGVDYLGDSLDVATLQRLTKLRDCPVEDVLSEKSESNIPAGADGKNVRKAMAERILKRLLKFSSPATFGNSQGCSPLHRRQLHNCCVRLQQRAHLAQPVH